MIRVEPRKPDPEDCKILAGITVSARKNTPLESDRSIEEIAKNIESLSISDDFQILVALNIREEIVGWTYYYTAFPLMTFISGFFPLKVSHESEDVAVALIEASKKNIAEIGHTRLELELEFPTKAHRTHSVKFVDWHRRCGFHFAAEEVRMKTDVGKIDLPELDLPPEHVLRNFTEVTYDQLEEVGFQIFEDSNDDLFLSMSHTEQKLTLKHYFDKTEPFIEEASWVLEREGKIIGFIITRMRDGEVLIGPVGILQEERGQGLANYIIASALASLKKIGKTSACLDMSITKPAAKKLYERYGFKDEYYKQFYYWSP
ncbi:MAG: GNAT family N-acetyltransferase [Candidatus Thorarchaeota archaeon]